VHLESNAAASTSFRTGIVNIYKFWLIVLKV
jgi:hypothetical protein